MTKPSFRVHPPSVYDETLNERLIRALQDSKLHVHSVDCAASDPTRPGKDWCIGLSLTAVTDGRRGFLILAEDFFAPHSDRELAEFMNDLYPDDQPRNDFRNDYRIRIACCVETEKSTPSRLELRDPKTTCADVETAYEQAFAGAPPIDHAAFFERFEPLHVRFDDEETRRAWIQELDDSIPPEQTPNQSLSAP